MNNFIEKIIAEKLQIYFISPHLDDAILSCGDLINYLSRRTNVTVLNIFTESSPNPITFSAKAFLKQCGFRDSEELFDARKKEDKLAFEKIGVEKYDLGFIDAQWRKKEEPNFFERKLSGLIPEIIHAYPIYRIHIAEGKISSLDRKMIKEIKESILNIINTNDNYVVFCPMAIGGNVDHKIVKEICLDIFHEKLILWADFPYSNKFPVNPRLAANYHKINFNFNKEKKIELLRAYKSQFDALVRDGMSRLTDEEYYF